uniref:Purinergic receptor P2Y13 n=1 Tax=Oryzias latipes TaxID=8090 RepID=A0A3P9LRW2_ORYLA
MQNNSSHPPTNCTLSSTETTQLLVAYLFFFSFPIAFLLNGIAAWVSFHLSPTSTFIVYLKTLVGADLLMTLMIPPMAASMIPGAALEVRSFNCRYAGVIFFTSLYTSITLMGLISLDRFFKIVRPLGKGFGQNVTTSIIMSSLVCVVLFGSTAIPTIVLTDQTPENATKDICMSMKGPAGKTLHNYVVTSMEILFWLITIMIVFCYICITLTVMQSFRNSGSKNNQGKKKTKLRVFSILLVYFVCFVPLHLLRIPFTIHETFDTSFCTPEGLLIAHQVSVWVSSTNACLDPFLYIHLCKEYREKLDKMAALRSNRTRIESSPFSEANNKSLETLTSAVSVLW